MKILVIEPYLSASHKQWLVLLEKHLPHEVRTLTLPGRHWKWRMHYAAINIAEQIQRANWEPDLVITSEMMDVALFTALTKIQGAAPVLLYFHENQITYPPSVRDDDTRLGRDHHYGFVNFSSALTADSIVFNSEFHRCDFLQHLPQFLKKFPEKVDQDLIHQIAKKSLVIAPGINHAELDEFKSEFHEKEPIILWNHRWEYDKNPELFFRAIRQMASEGLSFKMVVLGENHKDAPAIFSHTKDELSDQILHYGFVPSRGEYINWLWNSDIILSTSRQDYFGISVVEAIYCGCIPLLPKRLAFSEHIPASLQDDYLYSSEEDLMAKLRSVICEYSRRKQKDGADLRNHVLQYDISQVVHQYQVLFDSLF